VVAAFVAISSGGGSSSSGGGAADASAAQPTFALTSRTLAPLPAPISGESAAAVPGGMLVIGGLDSTEASVSGVFVLDTAGKLTPAGSLSGPLHDAAATAVGGRVLVFGGGTETSEDTVQSLPASSSPGAATTATVVGHLPAVRSDLSAVTIGNRAYVLGGYDGTTPDPSVLATTDGTSFSHVADLKVPARYLAAVAVGGRVFAFGGETANGGATDAIQEVDPAHGRARVVGHLPQAVSHAAAVVLGGSVYVLGGEANGAATDRAWRFDPATHKVSPAHPLPEPVAGGAAATVGDAAYLVGGTGSGGEAVATVVELGLRAVQPKPSGGEGGETADAGGESKSGSKSFPFEGQLMIADRGNDRILVVNAKKEILWRFPSKEHPAPPGGFYFPDDAFFIHHGTGIISNEEQNERIVQLAYPSGKLLWSYGHPGQAGSEPGYLHEPDDAYLLKNGNVQVADADNCRVLVISPQKKVLKDFGSPTNCTHEPPNALASPNGDTPLANGNMLVSEVKGVYIDEITPNGKVNWTVHLPISYPSDPQQLGPDLYLVVDYSNPGGIYKFNRAGELLWSYNPESGDGRLNHPSLAEELPGGFIAVNDDYRHRVAIIDPKTKKIVWQYGVTGHPGKGPDHLRIPDGFDLLHSNGVTPTHPYTG
jgi:hypothetical protein